MGEHSGMMCLKIEYKALFCFFYDINYTQIMNKYSIVTATCFCHLVLLSTSMQTYADNDDFLTPVTSSYYRIGQLLENLTNNTNSISICYNYNCQTQRTISISQENIQSIKKIFKQFNSTQNGERRAISHAIASLENIAATQTPVYNDKARNYNDKGLPGRMDCIDSTVNTTQYLGFINQLGLLNQHTLLKPVYRSPYLMGQHWSAQIKDNNDGQHYAVDSWQTNNGHPPVIQDVESWTTREDNNAL